MSATGKFRLRPSRFLRDIPSLNSKYYVLYVLGAVQLAQNCLNAQIRNKARDNSKLTTLYADIHYIVFMFKLKLQSCGLIKSALLGTLQLGGKHILTSSLSTRKVEISNNIFVATSCIYLLHDRASLLRGKFTKKTNKT